MLLSSAFQQLARIQFDRFVSPLIRDIDEVCGAARTIGIAFTIVKLHQRPMPSIHSKHVEHHPKIIALPDVIIFFVSEPARQFFRICQDARCHPFTKFAITLNPCRAAPIDRLNLIIP